MRRPSRRKRLRRDPCNQSWHKLRAWAKRTPGVEALVRPGSMLRITPRVIWYRFNGRHHTRFTWSPQGQIK